jgi:hypothetical protein
MLACHLRSWIARTPGRRTRHSTAPPAAARPQPPVPRPTTPPWQAAITRDSPVAGADAVPTTVAASPEDSYFLEPLLRSFLLGVGAGALVETTHVLFKFLGVAAESGPGIMDALPNALPEFAPLFVWDHVAAL